MSVMTLKNSAIAYLLLFFLGFSASAKPLGVGVILFGPTGFSANYFLSSGNSVDAALSWSLNDDDQNFYLHSTYLWHKRNFFHLDKVPLHAYYGIGGRLISWEDPPGKERDSEFRAGIRGAGGIRHVFSKTRIEAFGEISLNMDVVPETDADLKVGLGGRYYF